MKIIIGVTGKLGSGKDYITNNVIIPVLEKYARVGSEHLRYLQMAFADQIKINVMSKNNVTYDDVYENKTPESRQLLQKEGTEIGRKEDKNIWVKFLSNWIKVHYNRGITSFVLSDVRFMNEYDFVKNSKDVIGIMIKVVAPRRNNERLVKESRGDISIYEKISEHASECNLDNLEDNKFDLIIKNDINDNTNLDDLKLKFSKLLYEAQIMSLPSTLI